MILPEQYEQMLKDDKHSAWMLSEYMKQLAEQEDVKRVGYVLDRDCWNCKKHFDKLRYKICDNGYISYWCMNCY